MSYQHCSSPKTKTEHFTRLSEENNSIQLKLKQLQKQKEDCSFRKLINQDAVASVRISLISTLFSSVTLVLPQPLWIPRVDPHLQGEWGRCSVSFLHPQFFSKGRTDLDVSSPLLWITHGVLMVVICFLLIVFFFHCVHINIYSLFFLSQFLGWIFFNDSN